MIPLVSGFCHDSEYVLIPRDDELPELEDGVWYAGRSEVYDLGYRVVCLIYSDTLEQLKELRAKIGREPSANDLLTEPVLAGVKPRWKMRSWNWRIRRTHSSQANRY